MPGGMARGQKLEHLQNVVFDPYLDISTYQKAIWIVP